MLINCTSRRTFDLFVLVAIILVSSQCIEPICCQLDSTTTTAPTPNEQRPPPPPPPPPPSPSSGPNVFGLIMSPLRATYNYARRFLGDPISTVIDGVDEVQMQAFRMFTTLYNKTYAPEEIPRRMALFFDRRKLIENSMRLFREGRLPFVMRENAFVDWDEDEIKQLAGVSLPSQNELLPEELEPLEQENEIAENKRNKLMVSGASQSNDDADDDDDDDDNAVPNRKRMMVKADQIPASKDWRTTNCISTPISQLKCGACYAIATMSAVESMRCLNRDSAPILSPQQIVDCATPRAGYENYGCDGGWPTRVLKYLQDVGTAARESCYPFVRRQNSCRLRQVQATTGCTVSSSPTDRGLTYKVLTNERDILYHVAKTGPVVTVMKAVNSFLYYGSGIFDDRSCSNRRNDVDHAIVIVGYGRENGQDYWLIKNSWGTTTWGIGGYGKYKRGSNACSIGHWGWVITS